MFTESWLLMWSCVSLVHVSSNILYFMKHVTFYLKDNKNRYFSIVRYKKKCKKETVIQVVPLASDIYFICNKIVKQY